MRVAWICVCEEVQVRRGPKPLAVNIYLADLPWSPSRTRIPVAILLRLWHNHEELDLEGIAVHLVDEAGARRPALSGILPRREPIQEGWSIAWLSGELEISAPGRYELEVLLEGAPAGEASRWPLAFVAR